MGLEQVKDYTSTVSFTPAAHAAFQMAVLCYAVGALLVRHSLLA